MKKNSTYYKRAVVKPASRLVNFINKSKYRAKAFWQCLSCGHKFPELRANKPQRVCMRCESLDIEFWASQLEFRHWGELQLLQKAGKITFLEKQVPLHFEINDRVMFAYVVDFLYMDCRTGEDVYEDVKGCPTPLYKLKKKLIQAQFGIKITEVKR